MESVLQQLTSLSQNIHQTEVAPRGSGELTGGYISVARARVALNAARDSVLVLSASETSPLLKLQWEANSFKRCC